MQEVFVKTIPKTVLFDVLPLHVHSFGSAIVPPFSQYPSKTYFKEQEHFWERGRQMKELYLVYIQKGEGLFQQDNNAIKKVGPNTVMVLYPNKRHRYRPDYKTGWKETWIGIKGPVIDNLLSHKDFLGKTGLITPIDLSKFDRYIKEILEIVASENFGYSLQLAGTIMPILTLLHNSTRFKPKQGKRIERVVEAAKQAIDSNFEEGTPDIKQMADHLGVSYNWLRKNFKSHIGFSPHQYIIKNRIDKSCELLLKTSKTIKEIAFLSGFESPSYFCRLFVKYMGCSPKAYRIRE